MVRSRSTLRLSFVAFTAALGVLAPVGARATPRLAVLTLTAPWSPDCQGTAWRKDKVLLERCTVLETLADEARAGALAALEGRDVDVMTRENTAELLKEMGADAACSSEGECEVETAKLIGADYVVSGSVVLVERTWFATFKLHVVKNAKLVGTAKVRGKTQVEMIDATAAASRDLVAHGLKLRGPEPATGTRETSPPARPASVVVSAEGASTPGSYAMPAGMVLMPGGTYPMAATKRTVTVLPFLLDAKEVTVAAYAECVTAGKCSYYSYDSCHGEENFNRSDRRDHPINCVDFDQATAYCAAVGKRLPTEEEWEWAARGAERGTSYPWGNDAPGGHLCWSGDGSNLRKAMRSSTCAVASFPRGDSPQGVAGLAGNVSEWTASTQGEYCVRRGGCWHDAADAYVSAAFSCPTVATARLDDLGFRCAKSL